MTKGTTTVIVLKELAGHATQHVDVLQQYIIEHIALVTDFWISVWIVTALVLLWTLLSAYKNRQSSDCDPI